MSAQEILLTAIDQRYAKYLAERKRCKDDFSEEAVHDLRVAARRLMALIELLRTIIPNPLLQKLHRSFKVQLDSLDDLRDVQVMLAEISETLETLPDLAPLQKALRKREKRLLNSAEHEVRVLKVGPISHRIESICENLAKPIAGQDLIAQLLAVVDEANFSVLQRKKQVDPTQPSSIHRVRIAFKKFRYMVEIIYPILPGFPELQLKNMHNYQAAMGEIQDMEVMLQTLDDFAAGHNAYDPQPVRRFYEQRHIELINAYIENMHEFITFWRETPDKPFPWEVKEKELP